MRAHGFERPAGQTRLIPVGIKSAHASMFLRSVGVSVNQATMGHRRVGDPELAAVEQIAFTVLRRCRAQRRHVRTGVGLGDREAADFFTGDERRNKFFLLLFAAKLQQRQCRTDLHVDGNPHGAVGPRNLFGDQHHGEKAETVAAVRFRNHRAVETQLAHLFYQVRTKILFLIILGGARRDLLLGKLARQVAHRDELFR